MEQNKRNRVANFSNEEIGLLVSLVEKKKNIVECKKTDSVSSKTKDDEWENISKLFNSELSTSRSATHLRSKWDSLKKVTKKELAEEKLNIFKTGGGSAAVKPKSPWTEQIISIITIGATGCTSEFDSDVNSLKTIEDNGNNCFDTMNIEINNTQVIDENTPVILEADNSLQENEFNWSTWSPAELKKPVHPSLRNKRSNSSEQPETSTTNNPSPSTTPIITSKSVQNKKAKVSAGFDTNKHYIDLALKKTELVELQLELTKKEHEIKLQQQQELFILQKELLEKKIEIKKKKLYELNII